MKYKHINEAFNSKLIKDIFNDIDILKYHDKSVNSSSADNLLDLNIVKNTNIKEDNIDEKTLVPCERIFTQLHQYMDKHSFVMFGPLNYNVILMHNRLYDILNTTIKPLVLDIYNIVRKGNLTIKQLNKINDILSNIKAYVKTINKIITHNNA